MTVWLIIIKSPNDKVDKAFKYAVKHYFQTLEELDIILRTLSDKNIAEKQSYTAPAVENREAVPPPPVSAPRPARAAYAENTDFRQNTNPVRPEYQRPAFQQPGFQQNSFQPPTVKPLKKKLSPGLLVGMILMIIILAAMLTNPSEEMHRAAVKERFISDVYQPNDGLVRASAEDMGDSALEMPETMPVDQMLPALVYRKNFVLFSLTELRMDNEKKIIGTGFLGQVWVDEPESSSYQGSFHEGDIQQSGYVDEGLTDESLARQKEMKRAIIVAVMDKSVEIESASEQMVYKFVFHNRSNRNVKSFNGHVVIRDKSNNQIGTFPLTYDRPLGIGERAIFHVNSAYNPDDDQDIILKNTDLDELVMDWEPEAIEFNDGTQISLSTMN